MLKFIFLLISLAFLSGCATTANYEKVLNTWVGSNADNLVSSWGPPQGSYELSNGSHILEYISQNNAQVGGYTYTAPQTTNYSGNVNVYGSGGSAYGNYYGTSTTYVQKQTPVYNIQRWCKTRFTTNPNGIIQKWSWEGNNCKSLPQKGIDKNTVSINEVRARGLNLTSEEIENYKNKPVKIISETPTDESEIRASKLGTIFVKYETLFLLSEPGFSGTKLQSITTKEQLYATKETDNWVKVKTENGSEGWIAKSWLSK